MCNYEKFCCCCCNVVTCSKIVAILGLIAGVINLVYALMGALGVGFAASYVTTLYQNQIFGAILNAIGAGAFMWLSIILTAVWIIPDALLLVGINKMKPGFMLPWLIMKMILLVLFTIWSIALIGILAVGLGITTNILQDSQNNNLNNFGNFLDNIASVDQDQTRDLQNLLGDLQNQHNQQFGTTVNGVAIAVVVIYSIALAIANALAYYIWDIVKSAYKQIKEENRTNQHAIPYEMTSRNTYEQKPPAYAPV